MLAETSRHSLCSSMPQGWAGKLTHPPLLSSTPGSRHRTLGTCCGFHCHFSSTIQLAHTTSRPPQNSFGEETFHRASDSVVGLRRVLALKGEFSLLHGNSKTHVNDEIRRLNPFLPPFGCVEGFFLSMKGFVWLVLISFHISFFH